MKGHLLETLCVFIILSQDSGVYVNMGIKCTDREGDKDQQQQLEMSQISVRRNVTGSLFLNDSIHMDGLGQKCSAGPQ